MYMQRNWTIINKWELILDYQLITDTINRVVANQFSHAIKTEV